MPTRTARRTATTRAAAGCAPLVATTGMFRALADPHRVRIVSLLATSPDPGPGVRLRSGRRARPGSTDGHHHLKKLTQAGLLEREQRGQWAYCSLDRRAMTRLAAITDLAEGSR